MKKTLQFKLGKRLIPGLLFVFMTAFAHAQGVTLPLTFNGGQADIEAAGFTAKNLGADLDGNTKLQMTAIASNTCSEIDIKLNEPADKLTFTAKGIRGSKGYFSRIEIRFSYDGTEWLSDETIKVGFNSTYSTNEDYMLVENVEKDYLTILNPKVRYIKFIYTFPNIDYGSVGLGNIEITKLTDPKIVCDPKTDFFEFDKRIASFQDNNFNIQGFFITQDLNLSIGGSNKFTIQSATTLTSADVLSGTTTTIRYDGNDFKRDSAYLYFTSSELKDSVLLTGKTFETILTFNDGKANIPSNWVSEGLNDDLSDENAKLHFYTKSALLIIPVNSVATKMEFTIKSANQWSNIAIYQSADSLNWTNEIKLGNGNGSFTSGYQTTVGALMNFSINLNASTKFIKIIGNATNLTTGFGNIKIYKAEIPTVVANLPIFYTYEIAEHQDSSKTFNFRGANLTEDVNVAITGKNAAQFSIDGGITSLLKDDLQAGAGVDLKIKYTQANKSTDTAYLVFSNTADDLSAQIIMIGNTIDNRIYLPYAFNDVTSKLPKVSVAYSPGMTDGSTADSKIKFGRNDSLIINLTESPGKLGFFSRYEGGALPVGSVFTVEESTDGTTWTEVVSYDETYFPNNNTKGKGVRDNAFILNAATRKIKFKTNIPSGSNSVSIGNLVILPAATPALNTPTRIVYFMPGLDYAYVKDTTAKLKLYASSGLSEDVQVSFGWTDGAYFETTESTLQYADLIAGKDLPIKFSAPYFETNKTFKARVYFKNSVINDSMELNLEAVHSALPLELPYAFNNRRDSLPWNIRKNYSSVSQATDTIAYPNTQLKLTAASSILVMILDEPAGVLRFKARRSDMNTVLTRFQVQQAPGGVSPTTNASYTLSTIELKNMLDTNEVEYHITLLPETRAVRFYGGVASGVNIGDIRISLPEKAIYTPRHLQFDTTDLAFNGIKNDTISVRGISLTENVNVSIKGKDAAMFSIDDSYKTLTPATIENLYKIGVTFTPTEDFGKDYIAYLCFDNAEIKDSILLTAHVMRTPTHLPLPYALDSAKRMADLPKLASFYDKIVNNTQSGASTYDPTRLQMPNGASLVFRLAESPGRITWRARAYLQTSAFKRVLIIEESVDSVNWIGAVEYDSSYFFSGTMMITTPVKFEYIPKNRDSRFIRFRTECSGTATILLGSITIMNAQPTIANSDFNFGTYEMYGGTSKDTTLTVDFDHMLISKDLNLSLSGGSDTEIFKLKKDKITVEELEEGKGVEIILDPIHSRIGATYGYSDAKAAYIVFESDELKDSIRIKFTSITANNPVFLPFYFNYTYNVLPGSASTSNLTTTMTPAVDFPNTQLQVSHNSILTFAMASAPKKLEFKLKGKVAAGSTSDDFSLEFVVEESDDKSEWTEVVAIEQDEISLDLEKTFSASLKSSTRHIRFSRSDANFKALLGLGDILIKEPSKLELPEYAQLPEVFMAGEESSSAEIPVKGVSIDEYVDLEIVGEKKALFALESSQISPANMLEGTNINVTYTPVAGGIDSAYIVFSSSELANDTLLIIGSADATVVPTFATLRALRAAFDDTDADKLYKLTSNTAVSFVYEENTFLADSTAGIVMDTTYAPDMVEGNLVFGLLGKMSVVNGLLTFEPMYIQTNTTVSGPVTPIAVAASELATNADKYESALVKVEAVNFGDDAEEIISAGETYTITKDATSLKMYAYAGRNYIGSQTPANANITGIFNGIENIAPRSLTDIVAIPALSVNTNVIDLGKIQLPDGTNSIDLTITASDLSYNIALAPLSTTAFKVTKDSEFADRKGGKVTISTPDAPARGTYSDTLVITSGSLTQKVALKVEYYQPELYINPRNLNFNKVNIDSTKSLNLNVGAVDIVDTIRLSLSETTDFSLSAYKVSPAEALDVKAIAVRFKPTSAGAKSAKIYISCGNLKDTINLTGEGSLLQYTMTITEPANGSIVVLQGTDTVKSGDKVDAGATLTLKAIADNGYDFSKWWDNNTSAERTFTVTGDVTIAATFTLGTSINDRLEDRVDIYSQENRICVRTSEGIYAADIFNMNGKQERMIKQFSGDLNIDVTGNMLYFVRITDLQTKQSVVVKLFIK